MRDVELGLVGGRVFGLRRLFWDKLKRETKPPPPEDTRGRGSIEDLLCLCILLTCSCLDKADAVE